MFSETPVRVYIFIDYWNFVSSLNEIENRFQSDWTKIGPFIMREVQALDPAAPNGKYVYQGMRVVGSFDPTTEAGEKLKNWSTGFLSVRVTGCTAEFVERQRRISGIRCANCHRETVTCPKCAADIRGTEEKGVDTRIATEMITYAWEDIYDLAVLVSADRDFAPAVEILQSKGKKVVHAGFPPKGAILRQISWGSIDLSVKIQEIKKNLALISEFS